MSTTPSIQLCGHKVGPGEKLFVIAGPDSIESEEMALRHAHLLKGITDRLGVPYAFKCSYDKANRTSGKSFRGPGLKEGLRILDRVKREVGVPVLTDVHETSHVGPAAEVVDIIQIPAFLCRQTDLVEAVARSGRGVNLKKGQFVAPKDIVHSARKAVETGNPNILVTERGSSFGYNNLVVDMRGLAQMREAGLVVCMDATHAVQLPSSSDGKTGGERKFVSLLARSAAAAGIDALFTEVHEDPDRALCDGPCSLNPQMFEDVVRDVLSIRRALGHEAG
ncbi:3-deoxy-8-phosphooctulonate synthase [Corallococcus praedator]|uniref:3-deoxy-8-phosphooctulonate synthase n=1 Tax=Corallococcus praedator TaxID=2316724 RepID=A0ABX9QA05_9BACT|nr:MULTISPECIES: 3-deoxy-8-phosphooctulonate synthase [Corallococcus]RKH32240.1 3-deoxy-8-phosphooctulonate synthase [Corallococcus sp. CA031C]RKH95926.1 3-deoxy-8-phosphooctulonate synthase [Corallococcus praedator]